MVRTHSAIGVFCLVSSAVLGTMDAAAATRSWDAGGGTDIGWTTAANWSSNLVPTATDIARLDLGGKNISASGVNITVTGVQGPSYASGTGQTYLTLQNGKFTNTGSWILGHSPTGAGVVWMSNAAVTTHTLDIGGLGGRGTVYVRNGSRVKVAYSLSVSDAGTSAQGILQIYGNGSVTAGNTNIYPDATVTVRDGGELSTSTLRAYGGELVVTGGTLSVAGAEPAVDPGNGSTASLYIGADSSGMGQVTLTNSALGLAELTVDADGLLVVERGAVVRVAELTLDSNGAIVIAEGGTLIADHITNEGGTVDVQQGGKLHTIVEQGDGYFFGFPANEGLWRWNDELLVSYIRRDWIPVPVPPSIHHGTGDPTRRQARSLDGGLSWEPEDFVAKERVLPLPSGLNLADPSVTLKFRNENLFYSTTRGRRPSANEPGWYYYNFVPSSWHVAPHNAVDARTSYLIEPDGRVQLFASQELASGNGEQAFSSFIGANGIAIERSWLAYPHNHPGFTGPDSASMPSVVRVSGHPSGYTHVAAYRRRCDLDGAKIKSIELAAWDPKTGAWTSYGDLVAKGSHNPPSLVRLTADGRKLCLTYGNRVKTNGYNTVDAMVSTDFGLTWSAVIRLRDDATPDTDNGYV